MSLSGILMTCSILRVGLESKSWVNRSDASCLPMSRLTPRAKTVLRSTISGGGWGGMELRWSSLRVLLIDSERSFSRSDWSNTWAS